MLENVKVAQIKKFKKQSAFIFEFCFWEEKCISKSVFIFKCIFPKCIFAKCTRLACLLSFASLFPHNPVFFSDSVPNSDDNSVDFLLLPGLYWAK